MQALWLLRNLDVLSSESLVTALDDPDPRVREQAIALSEPRLPREPDLRTLVVAAADDADTRVRFRAALALGGLTSNDVIEPLAAIALAAPDDSWTRTAVATALPSHTSPLLTAILQSASASTPQPAQG